MKPTAHRVAVHNVAPADILWETDIIIWGATDDRGGNLAELQGPLVLDEDEGMLHATAWFPSSQCHGDAWLDPEVPVTVLRWP